MSKTATLRATQSLILKIGSDYSVNTSAARLAAHYRGRITPETARLFALQWFPTGTPDVDADTVLAADWSKVATKIAELL